MPLHLTKVQAMINDSESPLASMSPYDLARVFDPNVLATTLTSQERIKLFSLLPEGDRSIDGLMAFLGDQASPAPTAASAAGASSSSSSSGSNGGTTSEAPRLQPGGIFCPGPLLMDAVNSYQELLRSGYMDAGVRSQMWRHMVSKGRDDPNDPPTGYDYELGSRGRRREKYPSWKEKKNSLFWAAQEKPRALADATREECERLEQDFSRLLLGDSRGLEKTVEAQPPPLSTQGAPRSHQAGATAAKVSAAKGASAAAGGKAAEQERVGSGLKWTDLELMCLVAGERKFGNQWASMLLDPGLKPLLGRSATSLKDKWRAISGARPAGLPWPKKELDAWARRHRAWVGPTWQQQQQPPPPTPTPQPSKAGMEGAMEGAREGVA
eukprot:CAMPEP_0172650350 /NCGR_PEP_ID=MMETSP1068-20121228/242252_1 /TAXON_ID=35684 /ORGANISM="Pseudopedinella elastica, Strain CCMP716" /LENGTH=381 /DNA_ID=CAMNT_0013464715 /DNA_START=81 /DNA_END=1222 /DNA_ORIENTATION=+